MENFEKSNFSHQLSEFFIISMQRHRLSRNVKSLLHPRNFSLCTESSTNLIVAAVLLCHGVDLEDEERVALFDQFDAVCIGQFLAILEPEGMEEYFRGIVTCGLLRNYKLRHHRI